MLTRRVALFAAGIAALVSRTPAAAKTVEPNLVPCCMASVFPPDFRSYHGLLFDLPEGRFLVEHASLYTGRYMSVKDGPTRFVDVPEKDISRGTELMIPRAFLDEALALHAMHERLRKSEEDLWQRIRKANGIRLS